MPVIFGVDTRNTLRRAKVRVRAIARFTGSPSPSTSPGYPSISSRNRNRAAIERRPTAEFAPVITSTPPGNSFERTVFPESRDRGSLHEFPKHLALFDQRVNSLFRIALGHIDRGLDRQHGAGRLVDDIADPVVATLGSTQLCAFNQRDGLDRTTTARGNP